VCARGSRREKRGWQWSAHPCLINGDICILAAVRAHEYINPFCGAFVRLRRCNNMIIYGIQSICRVIFISVLLVFRNLYSTERIPPISIHMYIFTGTHEKHDKKKYKHVLASLKNIILTILSLCHRNYCLNGYCCYYYIVFVCM